MNNSTYTQEEPKLPVEVPPATQPTTVANNQQAAQVVKQALKDDQGLATVAKDIVVTVKNNKITLDGKVDNKTQINLATNTASALGGDDKVKNLLEVK